MWDRRRGGGGSGGSFVRSDKVSIRRASCPDKDGHKGRGGGGDGDGEQSRGDV